MPTSLDIADSSGADTSGASNTPDASVPASAAPAAPADNQVYLRLTTPFTDAFVLDDIQVNSIRTAVAADKADAVIKAAADLGYEIVKEA